MSDADPETRDDLALAQRCASGEAEAIVAVDAEIAAAAALAVKKLGGDGALADEVAQRLRERILVGSTDRPARITEYTGRGPLRGWLRVIATRDAIDLRRRDDKNASLADDSLAGLPAAELDPELQFLRADARAAFRTAFRAAFAALEPLDRDLIRRHHLGGETVDDLAKRHTVHRATVARWVARARERLLAETRSRLALDPTELDSLLRLVESRLEISLRSQL